MDNQTPDFKNQNIILTNEQWSVEISGGSRLRTEEFQGKVNKTILLADINEWTGSVLIKSIAKSGIKNECLIEGIDGGFYLHSKDIKDLSQSVQLNDDKLYFSLGFTFFSFDLIESQIIWQVRPDTAEIFEFYDLENDFLLRGELEIHRITKNGEIKWSFGGKDIWVNMEGKREVQIESNRIKLTDFNNDKYIIDFNGKLAS